MHNSIKIRKIHKSNMTTFLDKKVATPSQIPFSTINTVMPTYEHNATLLLKIAKSHNKIENKVTLMSNFPSYSLAYYMTLC